MATYTNYKSLEKPLSTEKYNIAVANKNNDVIDSELHKLDLKNQSQDELLATKASLSEHALNKTNPHEVTKSQIGLGNVNNTSDTDKPVSSAQQSAIDAALTQSNSYTDNKIAELNAIAGIQKNGVELPITEDRKVNIIIPEVGLVNKESSGLCPQLDESDNKFLMSDGTWGVPDGKVVVLTQEEYDALPDTKNSDDINYFITDGRGDNQEGSGSGGGGSESANITELTKAEYDALPDTKNSDGVLYFLTDGEGVNQGGSSGESCKMGYNWGGMIDDAESNEYGEVREVGMLYFPMFWDEPELNGGDAELVPDDESEAIGYALDAFESTEEGGVLEDGELEDEIVDAGDSVTGVEDANRFSLYGIQATWNNITYFLEKIPLPVEIRRQIFRGKNLGRFTSEHAKAIKDGSFQGMFIGDYFNVLGIWRIVDFDYWYGTGIKMDDGENGVCGEHHLVIMPDSSVIYGHEWSGAYNENVPVVTTGYANCYIRNKMKTLSGNNIKTVFKAGSILTHKEPLTISTTTTEVMDCDIELPSQTMFLGHNQIEIQVPTEINSRQLALFALNPNYISDPDNKYDGNNAVIFTRDLAAVSTSAQSYAVVMRKWFNSASLWKVNGDTVPKNASTDVRPVFGVTGGDIT